MNDDKIKMGSVEFEINSGKTKFFREISHTGLNEHKIISASNRDLLKKRVNLQKMQWEKKWIDVSKKRQLEIEKESNLDKANELTTEARNKLTNIENILSDSLKKTNVIDWNNLKDNNFFHKQMPIKPTMDKPKFTFIDKIFKDRKEKKIEDYEKVYKKSLEKWENELSLWKAEEQEFLDQQEEFNFGITQQQNKYLSRDLAAIYEYVKLVLTNSSYPESFPHNFEIEYRPDNKMLIVEYELPSQENMPIIKEVNFIITRKEFKEILLPQNQLDKMYDETLYKITLRTLHEIFESDAINAIDIISFNGWVESTNKSTGKLENSCILSIQVNKKEFLDVNLSKVDPKSCFKALKGVASSKLITLTPIKPILKISLDDTRFVDSYEMEGKIDNSTNIAAMDWEDFEHLIRELFEKEFTDVGGEVKVTQASRDGGVDAIAFDPDPIRGGKIVIQAKRYTNTVGVSAVRDLYGTVLNEGATKGILVTTSDYGSDSYNFAKDKPLTLLNGSNLLYLLEKHGTHAKIDLKEAKKLYKENNK